MLNEIFQVTLKFHQPDTKEETSFVNSRYISRLPFTWNIMPRAMTLSVEWIDKASFDVIGNCGSGVY